MNFKQLVTALVTEVPGCAVASAEYALRRALTDLAVMNRWEATKRVTTLTVGPGQQRVQLPEDCIRVRRCRLSREGGGGVDLQVRRAWDGGAADNAILLENENNLWFLKLPSPAEAPVTLEVCYEIIPSLNSPTDSNWFTEFAPDALLWYAKYNLWSVEGEVRKSEFARERFLEAARLAAVRDAETARVGTVRQMGG